MSEVDYYPHFRSRLSFQPLIRAWENMRNSHPNGAPNVYHELIDVFTTTTELAECVDDYQVIEKYRETINRAMSTVFPVTVSPEIYAAIVPFSYKAIFTSALFAEIVANDKINYVRGVDETTEQNVAREKLRTAYSLILNKFYGVRLPSQPKCICAHPDQRRKLSRYLALKFDSRFVDVTTANPLPQLTDDFLNRCFSKSDILECSELFDLLPVENFVFEGMMIVRIDDVTDQETIRQLRRTLNSSKAIRDPLILRKVENEIANWLGNNVHVSLTPFVIQQQIAALSTLRSDKSILIGSQASENDQQEIVKRLTAIFEKSSQTIWIDDLSKVGSESIFFRLGGQSWLSMVLVPLYTSSVVGCIEIFSAVPLPRSILSLLRPVKELVENALRRSGEYIESQINRVVREQFTAVQPAVEWKFTRAAHNYLLKTAKGEEAKMEPVVFDEVFPLYGAIDIRNSSGERNLAIQRDAEDQLKSLKAIILEAKKFANFPLLHEVESRIDQHMDQANHFLIIEQEEKLNRFFRMEAEELVHHLSETVPGIAEKARVYFSRIDPVTKLFSKHRLLFENTVTQINLALSRFIDWEQIAAQQIFPHYFERFVSDGIDFNLYIGQSICPVKKFSPVYLRNLKLWQLTTLAKAARKLHEMWPDMATPLMTSQLIMVHHEPISISFRQSEKKFDVDGAHHVRFEILKKRIDKIHIRNSNERLTKPGTVAVVYTQVAEIEEYDQFIDFLTRQNLLTGMVEKLELEDVQGVSGLKALRAAINFDDLKETTQSETTQISSGQPNLIDRAFPGS